MKASAAGRKVNTSQQDVPPLQPTTLSPGTHFVQAMATNEAVGIQVEGGIGIKGPGGGREAY